MVTYGGMSRKPVTVPTSALIFKNIQLKGFWLTKWLEEHSPEEKQKMLDHIFELIRTEKLKLWMERKDFSSFPSALEAVKETQRNRKIVLMMDR
jgi:trans-2-enoyl-CoA reductase